MNYLTTVEEVQVKILYKSLSKLLEEQREVLERKYRVFLKRQGKPNCYTDAELHKKYGISLLEYQEYRRRIETVFKAYLLPIAEEYQEELSRAIDLVHRK